MKILNGLFVILTICLIGQSVFAQQIKKQIVRVVLVPENRMVQVKDTLILDDSREVKELRILLNKTVILQKVLYGGSPIRWNKVTEPSLLPDSVIAQENSLLAEYRLVLPPTHSKNDIVLHYEFAANDSINKAAFSREYIAYEVKAYIGPEGAFFSPASGWYPQIPKQLSRYKITAELPDSLRLITQGELVLDSSFAGKRVMAWNVNYPAADLHLVAAPFVVSTQKYQNINVQTWLFKGSEELSDSYLKASARYLAMYENRIGPYPFTKFAVVENFFPTGYGMPSYTLLGSQVLRLPFIIHTSLGHEVAHNWWGNSVYVDYDSGNWCEGLTTYYADYSYKEARSEADAIEYRRNICRDFSVYVKDEKDFPLNRFTSRTENASRAIGYGKSAMVFHQLKLLLGDSLFQTTMRNFYSKNQFRFAGWADIQAAAEAASGKQLAWFFEQWVQRKGAPKISLHSVKYLNGSLTFTLKQVEPFYQLLLPLLIEYPGKSIQQTVLFDAPVKDFSIPLKEKPLALKIDPGYNVLRFLERSETPPTLSEIFAADSLWIVLPDLCDEEKQQIYHHFAEQYADGEEGIKIIYADDLSNLPIPSNIAVILMGTLQENSAFQELPFQLPEMVSLESSNFLVNGAPLPQPDDLTVLTFRRQGNAEQSVCVIALGTNKKTGRVAALLKHYGKYSYLNFRNGRNLEKGVYPVKTSPLFFYFK